MMQHTRESEVGDARGEAAVYQNVALRTISRRKIFEEPNIRFSDPHARMASHGGISVHEQHPLAAEVESSRYLLRALERILTSFSRLVSGCAVTKSMIVPCSIHSETINSPCKDLVAPTSSNRFGCLNCFHNTSSQQKSYSVFISTWQVSAMRIEER